jgi:hypothetical protein
MQIKNATILAAGSFATLLAGGVSAQADTKDGLTGQTVDKNGLKRFAFNAVGVDKQPRTFYVDENGVPVASNALGKIPKDIPGYELVKTNETPDEIHYVYRVKPQAKTTVFVEKDGKVIIPESYGELDKRDIPGYTFVETKVEGDKTSHIYEKKEVVVKSTVHVDEEGNSLIPEEFGFTGKASIPGYVHVNTTETGTERKHVYKKIPVEIRTTVYVDKTGKVLIPETLGTLEKRDLPGYTFVETKTEGNKTIHVYEMTPYIIKATSHLDEEGNNLIPEEFGFTNAANIPGYTHKSVTEDDVQRTHVYTKNKVEIKTTEYVAKDGKVLIPETLGTLEKRDIPTYTYVETKVEGNKTIHVYEPTVKKTTVNLRVVDEDTGVEIIKPFEIGKGEIGSTYNLTDEVVANTLKNLPEKDRVAVYNKTTGSKVISAIVNTSNGAFDTKHVDRVDDKGKMDFIDNSPVEERTQSSLIRDNYVLSNADGAYNLNAVPEEKDTIAWYENMSYWQFYQGDAENLVRLLKYKYQEAAPNAADINSLVYLDQNRQTLSAFDLHYIDFSQSDSVGKRLDKTTMELAEDGNSNLFTIYVKADKLKDRSNYLVNDHI